jgi:hypothetical protein
LHYFYTLTKDRTPPHVNLFFHKAQVILILAKQYKLPNILLHVVK